MSWTDLVKYHKHSLVQYFDENYCSKCLYGKTFEENDFSFVCGDDNEIEEYEQLCDECIFDTPRTLRSVVFAILLHIFETQELYDFSVVLKMLNKHNIVPGIKETIFKYCVCRYKETDLRQYFVGIRKILSIGINVDYNFVNGANSFMFDYLFKCSMRNNFPRNKRMKQVGEIYALLNEKGYQTHIIKSNTLKLTNLGYFVMFNINDGEIEMQHLQKEA